ncbi:MAG: ATP-binding protein [Rhizomicrobium sp.]|jgi:PAS domain S-box-containing protein
MASDGADAQDRGAGQTAETVLANERAQFLLAERAARFGYWRLRLADNHVTWSPGMYRLLNIDQNFAANNDWLLDQIVADDVKNILEKIGVAIRTRSGFRYVTHAKITSATAQIVETQGEVEIGPDGRVVALIGVCRDVTTEVVAETARAKAEQMYRVMAEQASDIIILYGEQGKILCASDALWRILKRTVAEIDRSEYLRLIHPDDRTAAVPLETWPEDGATTITAYRVLHGDGHYVWLETTTRAIYDADGNFRNGISVGRDVSERKSQALEMQAAREHAEAASKAKSGFLANMSHELRTPLNAIIGFSDIMREELFGALGDARYKEYAGLIGESGKLLLDLITDILDMAKIEAGKMELHVERVDLAGAIEDCTKLLQPRACDAGVDISAHVHHGATNFFADRRAITQILLNLLSNAVKFSLPGGHVRVEARAERDSLALSVADNGVGIPADQLPRLGKPFEQVCVDPMLAKGGTGLGLALVQALAQRHGGAMRIESEEGVGTTVTVELPLKPQAANVAA